MVRSESSGEKVAARLSPPDSTRISSTSGKARCSRSMASRSVSYTHLDVYKRQHYARIEDILEQGLHEWLTDFMDRIYMLGDGISKAFLVPMSEAA